MPMTPDGPTPQQPYTFSPFGPFSDNPYADDGLDTPHPPRTGPDEPGIPTGDNPDPMTRFRDEHDLYGSEVCFETSSTQSRSYNSNSSTGFFFPLLLLIGAIWFALGMPLPISVYQPEYTQEQVQ